MKGEGDDQDQNYQKIVAAILGLIYTCLFFFSFSRLEILTHFILNLLEGLGGSDTISTSSEFSTL